MENMVASWKYDNRIPSDPDFCAKIIELLLGQLEKNGWNGRDVFGIHMAMEEAIMNAIRHGNCCASDKEVHVVMEISDTEFRARITDQGCGFDPDALPDPTIEENLDKTCGRGVMLMKSFVDCVNFNEKGNSVSLAKTKTEK